MINKPLQQPVAVAPGGIASVRIPTGEDFTLVGVKFLLGGTTFDKSKITRIKVMAGARVLWDLLNADFNAINNYKNGADNSKYLLLDFVERDQALFPLKEIGGLDLKALASLGDIVIQVYIDATAVAPTLSAVGYFEPSQNNPWVLKYLPFTFATPSAGKFTLPLSFRGAMLKRVFLRYTGTNWGAAANGNLSRMEVKKNGLVISDQYDLDNRFDQVQYKKVPQGNFFVQDFIMDNNHDAHVATVRDAGGGNLIYDNFEFNAYITDAAGGTVTAIVEVLDTATNL